jgi:hypothetical protein
MLLDLRIQERLWAMRAWDVIKTVSQKAGDAVSPLADAFPPYFVVEGVLGAKEVGRNGRYFIHVGDARIAVDHPTFEALTAGERVRVRYTRGFRAVSIDRFVSANGHF